MSVDPMQKFGKENMDMAMTAFGAWAKNAQAIATEVADYSKKSFEDSAAAFEKLIGAALAALPRLHLPGHVCAQVVRAHGPLGLAGRSVVTPQFVVDPDHAVRRLRLVRHAPSLPGAYAICLAVHMHLCYIGAYAPDGPPQ